MFSASVNVTVSPGATSYNVTFAPSTLGVPTTFSGAGSLATASIIVTPATRDETAPCGAAITAPATCGGAAAFLSITASPLSSLARSRVPPWVGAPLRTGLPENPGSARGLSDDAAPEESALWVDGVTDAGACSLPAEVAGGDVRRICGGVTVA